MHTYFHGDKAEYTGRIQVLYGKVCYEVRVVEGHLKGQFKWTYVEPPQTALEVK
jgi:hypothetical protein